MRNNVRILLIVLLVLLALSGLILAIVSISQSNNNASNQNMLAASIVSLNESVNSIVNTTQTGASIVFDSGEISTISQVNRSYSYFAPALNFTFARYNDGGLYWSSNEPFKLIVPITGRYALSTSCTTIFAQVTGYTFLHGFVYITYYSPIPSDCPKLLAGALVTAKPTIDGLGMLDPFNLASPVSAYIETELTGGNGEWIGLYVSAAYNPALTPNDPPVFASPDSCTMSIRYLGPSTGTPLVTQVCNKKKGHAK